MKVFNSLIIGTPEQIKEIESRISNIEHSCIVLVSPTKETADMYSAFLSSLKDQRW